MKKSTAAITITLCTLLLAACGPSTFRLQQNAGCTPFEAQSHMSALNAKFNIKREVSIRNSVVTFDKTSKILIVENVLGDAVINDFEKGITPSAFTKPLEGETLESQTCDTTIYKVKDSLADVTITYKLIAPDTIKADLVADLGDHHEIKSKTIRWSNDKSTFPLVEEVDAATMDLVIDSLEENASFMKSEDNKNLVDYAKKESQAAKDRANITQSNKPLKRDRASAILDQMQPTMRVSVSLLKEINKTELLADVSLPSDHIEEPTSPTKAIIVEAAEAQPLINTVITSDIKEQANELADVNAVPTTTQVVVKDREMFQTVEDELGIDVSDKSKPTTKEYDIIKNNDFVNSSLEAMGVNSNKNKFEMVQKTNILERQSAVKKMVTAETIAKDKAAAELKQLRLATEKTSQGNIEHIKDKDKVKYKPKEYKNPLDTSWYDSEDSD